MGCLQNIEFLRAATVSNLDSHKFEYRAATVASNRKSGVTVESRWVFMLKSLTFSQWSFELKAATKYETRPNRESALRVSESERAWTNGEVCGCIANQSGPLGFDRDGRCY